MEEFDSVGYNIYHDISIEASINKIFQAVSQPELLINWWPKKCSGKPELGSDYNFYFTDEYDWYGKVSKFEKNKSFHIKMTKSDADWDPTSFGFDLEEQEKGALLHFWHTGWPQNNHHFRRSSFCWAILLNGLKNYVEKRVIVPFEERA